jgi:Tol biopolymer transport system component
MTKNFTSRAGPEQLKRLLSSGLEEAADEEQVAPTATISPWLERLGSQIGRYELLSVLGEGGMGMVYLAEQKRPIRRQVALKIIKPGMDSARVIARFEAERQALALLDHPNIAHVFDAGTTNSGRPYFVMEYVKGLPITEHCDRRKLGIEDRLALFLQVCHGLQHAHHKGIVHRDIKPSNILVAVQEDRAIPKIIDFGVAKAMSQPLTERPLATEDSRLLGTPEYMSPEQAEMAHEDIDTRSDVYSLGVLLYELLTGMLPFDVTALREGGIERVRQVIRETAPKTPSRRLTSLGEEARKIADSRRMEVAALARRLHRELEWVPLKAMRKERQERYRSAAELADDVENYLSGAPLIAGPPGALYRLKKLVQRHRVFVAAAAVVAATLCVGLVVSTAMYVRAQRALEALTSLESDVEADRILSTVQRLHAEGRYQAALTEMETNIRGEMLTAKGRLLHARLLSEVGRLSDAVAELAELTAESPETAGAAHYLLAAIYAGSDSDKAQEHQGQAESLLPETAEAYCLRATTAGTPEETLQWLATAIRLYPDDYASRKARALTYYGQRDHGNMERDVEVMIALRPRDCLGYALRAIVRRELGLPDEAINDHDHAIRICDVETELAELHDQRRKTHYQMYNYEQALSDARHCVGLRPDRTDYRFYVFAALVALGHYEQAKAEHATIAETGPEVETRFDRWAAKHVFNTLGAERPLNLPDRSFGGSAFRAMHDAVDCYRRLDAKADRLITDGISPSWSPDGKRLAYARSDALLRETLSGQVAGSALSNFRDIEILNAGSRGIEILDLDSDSKRLLVSSGKNPIWSPDKESIAFTSWPKLHAWFDEEVWITPTGGGQAEFISDGGSVAWTGDSKGLYLTQDRHPVLGSCLYRISAGEVGVVPEQLTTFPSTEWAISPDDRYVAYVDHGELRIMELHSGALVASWKAPMGQSRMSLSWSPDGHEVSVAGRYESHLGLWIYEVDTRQAFKVFDGPVTRACWSPNGNRMAFELGQPYFEIWTVDLEQGIPTSEALAPARSIEDHYEDLMNHYIHSIEIDALSMDDYQKLARLVGDFAWRGIEQYRRGEHKQALVTLSRIEEARHLLDEETHPAVLAFIAMAFHKLGQNQEAQDACDRFCRLIGGRAGLAAEFIFTTPINLGPPFNTSYYEATQWVSSDSLEFFFHSTRPPSQGQDLWVATRSGAEDQWGEALHLGPVINSPLLDWGPSISTGGLELYFCSSREGGIAGDNPFDIWMTSRATRGDAWGEPVNLGSPINTTFGEASPCISGDSLLLFFASDRPGGYGGGDIWVTTRTNKDDPWGEPVNLGSTVNSPAFELFPSISSDGLTLFFTSGFLSYPARPGGFGGPDLWVTKRASKDSHWGEPVNLGPLVNTAAEEACPYISPDASTLYFSSDRPGGLGNFDLWQVCPVPLTDVDGDGQLDVEDLCRLEQRHRHGE